MYYTPVMTSYFIGIFLFIEIFLTLQVLFTSTDPDKRVWAFDSYSSLVPSCKLRHFPSHSLNSVHFPITNSLYNIEVLFKAKAITWPIILNRIDAKYLLPFSGPIIKACSPNFSVVFSNFLKSSCMFFTIPLCGIHGKSYLEILVMDLAINCCIEELCSVFFFYEFEINVKFFGAALNLQCHNIFG